jgi:hypothetical protein
MLIMRAVVIGSLGLASFAARAVDYGPLLDVVKQTWPTRTHIAVIAAYNHSCDEIQALAEAAGEGSLITVVDVAENFNFLSVPRFVASRVKPDYVVLLRNDSMLRGGALETTWVVGQLAQSGIPSIGTTPMAIRQGALFALGEETGNELLVTPEVKGSMHVTLPVRENYRSSVSALHDKRPAAAIQVRFLAAAAR